MAKLFNNFIKRFGLRNAPSSGGSKGVGGGFNRDPKATQVKRVGYALSSSSAGGGGRGNFESPEADFDTITNALQRDSYIMQATMKYEELIFKAGYALKAKDQNALDYIKLRFDMMAVATQIPTEELWHGIARDIIRYANSFVVKARAKGGQGLPPGVTAIAMPPSSDPIGGYFILPASTMAVGRDPSGQVKNYQQTVQGSGSPKTFKAEDMVHFVVNRQNGKAFGDPFLATVIEDVRLLRKIEENAALLLYRHIFPLLAYTVGLDKPGSQATDDELSALRAEIENMPTDGALVLPERHKIEAVKMSVIDGKPYLDYYEQRVFTGLGMSQVDMGRGDTANRNTADAMGGIKVDRVKGWQKAIANQINKYIIEELLVEGGMDPLVNPDFKVEFVFNEIEAETRIKLDTHEIFKFEHNLQTWEETRTNMSMEPTADEARLYFNMVQIPLAEATANAKAQASGTAATNNKQQPSNQHGTRTGPKKSTQRLESVQVQDNVVRLTTLLERTYALTEQDMVEEVKRYAQRQEFPMRNPKTLISSIHFAKDRMLKDIKDEAQTCLLNGSLKAKSDAGRNQVANIPATLAGQTVETVVKASMDLLEATLFDGLEKRLKEADDLTDGILAVRSTFQALRHRLGVIALSTSVKSYNYGYILAMMKYEESAVVPVASESTCPTCQERASQPIQLSQLSSLDEVAIYSSIPSWHPNCECSLMLQK